MVCVCGGGGHSQEALSLRRDVLGSGPGFYLRVCPEVPVMGNGWGLIKKKKKKFSPF